MDIVTVSDLVERLGGTVKVAGVLGTSSQQVSNMRAENYIPPKHIFMFRSICARASIEMPERFFIKSRSRGEAA